MRTTITLNDSLFKNLKLRAAVSGQSISGIIEAALIQQILEDSEDIEDANARAVEPVAGFAELLAEFRAEGLIDDLHD